MTPRPARFGSERHGSPTAENLAANGTARHRVAVLMAAYAGDRVEHVRQALASILEQEHSDLTVFLMLDGAVESGIMRYLAEVRDSRLVVRSSPRNRGLAAALNALIDEALQGPYEFLARMDCDDVADRSRLRKQIEYLRRHPDIAVVGSYCYETDELGRRLCVKRVPEDDETLKRKLIRRCPFIHSTVVLRREVFETAVRYPVDHHLTEDMFLWADLAALGYKFANIPEPLLDYRIGAEFYRRRRGYKKAVSEFRAKRYVAVKVATARWEQLLVPLGAFALRMLPGNLLRLCYRHMRPVEPLTDGAAANEATYNDISPAPPAGNATVPQSLIGT